MKTAETLSPPQTISLDPLMPGPGILASRGLIYTTTALLAATFAWASLTEIDAVVQAPGQLLVKGEPFHVAPPESGLVAEVAVRVGDHVDEGDALLRLDAFQYTSEAKRIMGETGAAFIELKTLKPYPDDLAAQHSLEERRYWIRSLTDLRGKTKEDLWKEIGSKTRNMIRQAQKASLTFEKDPLDDRTADRWYGLHLRTQKRLGLPPLPHAFFHTMIRCLGETREIGVFFVRCGKEDLAGTIVLLERKTGIYGYAASLTKAQDLRPNDFLIFRLAEWLLDHGCEWLDMGSDSPQQTGLLFFKRKWLADQRPLPTYTFGPAEHAATDSTDRRYSIFRKVFRCLPCPALRIIGNRTARYFG